MIEPRLKDEESGQTFQSVRDYWLYWCQKEGIDAADKRYNRLLERFINTVKAIKFEGELPQQEENHDQDS